MARPSRSVSAIVLATALPARRFGIEAFDVGDPEIVEAAVNIDDGVVPELEQAFIDREQGTQLVRQTRDGHLQLGRAARQQPVDLLQRGMVLRDPPSTQPHLQCQPPYMRNHPFDGGTWETGPRMWEGLARPLIDGQWEVPGSWGDRHP